MVFELILWTRHFSVVALREFRLLGFSRSFLRLISISSLSYQLFSFPFRKYCWSSGFHRKGYASMQCLQEEPLRLHQHIVRPETLESIGWLPKVSLYSGI